MVIIGIIHVLSFLGGLVLHRQFRDEDATEYSKVRARDGSVANLLTGETSAGLRCADHPNNIALSWIRPVQADAVRIDDVISKADSAYQVNDLNDDWVPAGWKVGSLLCFPYPNI